MGGEFAKGMTVPKKNPDRDIEGVDDDEDEAPLPQPEDDEPVAEDLSGEGGSLALGRAAVLHYAKLAPAQPGVYRMIDARGDVLYVGKAKNVRNRVRAYARPAGLDTRIERMIAATRALEFVVTRTETEALLLEANLIKRLRPRFNVLLRDDKSFPYIMITSDHWAPQILKHRGARSRQGQYYGPFASVWAVNRTINALQRAFLLRSCSDPFFESRTRPCLLHQIKRCSAPCTNEIDFAEYAALVREANAFLSGRSKAVKDELAGEMENASLALDYERAAVYRDRLAALSAIQAHQGVNPRGVEEADVFALHQQGGFTCVEVFFFRTGQNWGNRAYFPKADRGVPPDEIFAAFLAQFYDDKPCPRLILISQDIEDRALLAEALTTKSGHKIEVMVPQRGERKDLIAHALANAREALGRKLAETSSQQRLLRQLTETFGLPRVPRRIEVYDNSHIQGSNAVGAMIVAGAEGFRKSDYRKFNIRSADLTPGDDFAMMREVLMRRFKRLLAEGSPRLVHRRDPRRPSFACRPSPFEGGDNTAALPPGETDILRAQSDQPRRIPHGPTSYWSMAGRGSSPPRRRYSASSASTCRWSLSPRDRTGMPGARRSLFPAATHSNCRPGIQCFTSSSGFVTKRIVSPSVRTESGAGGSCAKPACRRLQASAQRASALCFTISARLRRLSAPPLPICCRSMVSALKRPVGSTSSSMRARRERTSI